MARRAAALLLALVGWAAAQCGVAPGSQLDNLTLEGFGSAYFKELRFDQAADLAEFYGGVCIVGLGWALLTERVVLSGLSAELRLSAESPELRLPGLALRGSSLDATELSMTMSDVTLDGLELRGSAASLVLDLISNALTLFDATLIGANLLVVGERAVLDGDTLTIHGATATTCACDGPPLYTVSGSVVAVDLARERVSVRDGRLHLGPLDVDLGQELTLTADDLDDAELPFTLTYEGASGGDPGDGLGLAIPSVPLADGIGVSLDLVGLDPGRALGGSALLAGRSRRASFSFGVVDGGIASEAVLTEPILPWLAAELAVRNLDRAAEDRLHEGAFRLVASASLALPASLGRLEGSGTLLAAASSQAVAPEPVSSARLRVSGRVDYRTLRTPVGRGRLALEASATAYPTLGASQLVAGIAPGWRFELGPAALDLGYRRVWSDAGSPFSVRLDRRLPASALEATFELELPLAAVDLGVGAELGYDLLAGAWSEASVGALARLPVGRDDTVGIGAAADLLGLLEAAEPAWVGASADWRHTLAAGTAELALDLRADLVEGAALLAWIDVAGAYPLVGRGATVTPFLAVDVLPLLQGGAPAVSGHGVDLAWDTCCGTLLLGYRVDRDGFALDLGVSLTGLLGTGTMAPVEPGSP